MSDGRIKVYTYTRVSTTMQVDGYSLDAQKARMKAFAEFNNYEIVGEYEDAGKLILKTACQKHMTGSMRYRSIRNGSPMDSG